MNNSSISSLSAIPKKQLIEPPEQPRRDVYDVIILGRQPGGLLAGALLAKRGLTVLQLDPFGHEPFYEKDGTLFPSVPTILPPLRLFPRLEQALSELGITNDLIRYQESSGHALQVVRHRMRFDHFLDEKGLETEARRNFPETADAVRAVFSDKAPLAERADPFLGAAIPFPPKGFWDRFRLRRPVRELFPQNDSMEIVHGPDSAPPAMLPPAPVVPEAEQMKEVLATLRGYLTGFEDDNPVGVDRVVSQTLKGAYSITGGALGLGAKFGQRMLELGSDVMGCADKHTKSVEVMCSLYKISQLKLNENKDVKAGCYICAMDVADFARMALPDKYVARMEHLAQTMPVAKSAMTVNLLVATQGLPPGLSPRAVMFSHKCPELGGILIEVSQARTRSAVMDNCSVVSASVRLAPQDMDTEDKLKWVASQIHHVLLDELMPFLDRHTLQVSIPALDAPCTPPTAVTFHRPPKSYLGLTGLPFQTCLRNVYLANRQVVPGLGLEGELLAGIRLAEIIQKKLHKHNPLK